MTNQTQQQEQGTEVEMKYLLDTYMRQTMELTRENMMLKAFIAQMNNAKENAQAMTLEQE